MSFPAKPSEITVAWLNEALQSRGLVGEHRVAAFEIAPAFSQGGTSSAVIVSLSYDPPSAALPGKILAKFSSESAAVREKAREHSLYQREIAFYMRLGDAPGIRTPACYFARLDDESNRCVLLLEFIEGTSTRDVHEGSPKDIEAAVRLLAPFHARWWNQGSELSAFASDYAPARLPQRVAKVRKALQRVEEEGHRGAMGETCFSILAFWSSHADLLARYRAQRPMTLCHGSFHRGQILFPEDDSKLPWIIDWQSASLDLGAIDLARIVVSGLLPQQQRTHERQLVSLYHKLLLEHGTAGYTLEDLDSDYRFGIMNVIVFHSLILADYPIDIISRHWKGKAPFWDMLFHWPAEAAQDWKVLDWLKRTVESIPSGS